MCPAQSITLNIFVPAPDWGGNTPTTPAASQMPQTTDVAELAEYSASLYAQNPEEHATYLQYYTNYYTQQQQEQVPSHALTFMSN